MSITVKKPIYTTNARPSGGRYLSETERLRRRKKRQQQLMIKRGIVGLVALGILILIIVLICKGCSGGSDVLAGKWNVDCTTFYEFDGDGKGALILPSKTYDFAYKIDNDQIHIDYENESVHDGSYTFKIDGNKLTLVGGEGTIGGTYELTKVENKK